MRSRSRIRLAAALLAASAPVVPAAAQSVVFSFDDMSASNVDFTFTLPRSPTPDAVFDTDFEINGVEVLTNINGVATTTIQDLQFLLVEQGGGVTSFQMGTGVIIADLLGPQLFTGPTSMPTFLLGSFELTAGRTSLSGSGTLTISQAVATAVPEPATWTTMLLGFGAVGHAMRRRKLGVRTAATA